MESLNSGGNRVLTGRLLSPTEASSTRIVLHLIELLSKTKQNPRCCQDNELFSTFCKSMFLIRIVWLNILKSKPKSFFACFSMENNGFRIDCDIKTFHYYWFWFYNSLFLTDKTYLDAQSAFLFYVCVE